MRAFKFTLNIIASAFILVAMLHLTMGQHADQMLGSPITETMAKNPSLDAQNRFYGVTFSFLGVALLICSQDLARFAPILTAALCVLFASGIARAVAWFKYGPPAPALIAILLIDLILPPLLYLWSRAVNLRRLSESWGRRR